MFIALSQQLLLFLVQTFLLLLLALPSLPQTEAVNLFSIPSFIETTTTNDDHGPSKKPNASLFVPFPTNGTCTHDSNSTRLAFVGCLVETTTTTTSNGSSKKPDAPLFAPAPPTKSPCAQVSHRAVSSPTNDPYRHVPHKTHLAFVGHFKPSSDVSFPRMFLPRAFFLVMMVYCLIGLALL